MTTATSSPRPIRAAGPAPGRSKTWFRLYRHAGNEQSPENGLFAASCASVSLCALVGTDGRIFTSTEPFSAPIEPPAKPPAATPHRSPLRVLPPPNPSPSIPRPLSFLLAYQGQGVRMQARPRSLPPLSLAAALLGSVRAAARAARPRHRPDRAARASDDRSASASATSAGSIRPETDGPAAHTSR